MEDPSLRAAEGQLPRLLSGEAWPRLISISFAWPFILWGIPSHPRSPFLPWRKGPGLGPPSSAPDTAPLQREGQWGGEEAEGGESRLQTAWDRPRGKELESGFEGGEEPMRNTGQ